MTKPWAKVAYERRGVAALLRITRPERRNAVDAETAAGLAEGFHRFEDDPDARALILAGGDDEAFCAGADLKAIAEAGVDSEGAMEWVERFGDGPLGFTRLAASKPTIAAISGWCLAGGLELALWCDLRVGTQTAKLGFTERRFGVPLIDGGTQRLPRIVGMGRALDMILTGRVLEAGEAHQWGLLNEVVTPGRHLDRALEIAEGLAAFPQETMLSDRRAALEGAGLTLADGLALEAELGAASVAVGVSGAARFAAGEGRGAAGAGV